MKKISKLKLFVNESENEKLLSTKEELHLLGGDGRYDDDDDQYDEYGTVKFSGCLSGRRRTNVNCKVICYP
jgi:hypothetical protein